MGEFGPWHIVIVLIVFALLFGGKRLPDAARGLGQSLRIFRREMNGAAEPAPQPAEPTEQAAPAQQPPAEQAPPVLTVPAREHLVTAPAPEPVATTPATPADHA